MTKATLVIVDDEEALLGLLKRRLERLDYHVFSTVSAVEALEIIHREDIDVLITDFKMPGMNGAEVIARAIEIDPMLQSIVVTGFSNLKTAIDVMGAGAFNYLQKPVDFSELDVTIQKGLEKRKLLEDVQNKQRQLEEYREHLEELVENRTRALTETNQILQSEIEERKRLENTLREAKVVAEAANKAKSEFLANMSHEIRTPMTSAIGLLNLVLDTKLLPKQKAYLEMARISTVVMHNLLNDILDFSKIEAGKLNLESIAFHPRKVIESIIELQHLQAEEKLIQLSYSVDANVPESVNGDPNRLRQVILNLVSNAIKFTQYGDVLINCKIFRESHPDDGVSDENFDVLQFSIRDSGIGIDKEKIECIFEAFTQADTSTTRKFGGVGLGLNISSKLVAMMGGRIWVESKPGQGSTFHFTCKFEKGRDEEKITGQHQQKYHLPPIKSLARNTLSVLLVEDDQTNQWVFQQLLDKMGFSVVAVSDGITALQEIENRTYDLILLDLQLPEMTGYDIAYQIRENELNTFNNQERQIPIIAMTGFLKENEMEKCLAAGMNDFIAKPFTADQLLEKIQKHIYGQSIMNNNSPNILDRELPDISVLGREIFNELNALKNASNNQKIMVERLKHFLLITPGTIELFRKLITTDDNHTLEQEIHTLKEKATTLGATNFADELFSLIMKLRNKQPVKNIDIDILEAEYDIFCNDQKILTLCEIDLAD